MAEKPMTKDEREAIRARYNNLNGIQGCPEHLICFRLIQHIPALLDALDAETKRADEEDGKSALWQAKYIGVCFDRDRWKARAEALERALRYPDTDIIERCYACIHELTGNKAYCPKKGVCDYISEWRFDQARFSSGTEEKE